MFGLCQLQVQCNAHVAVGGNKLPYFARRRAFLRFHHQAVRVRRKGSGGGSIQESSCRVGIVFHADVGIEPEVAEVAFFLAWEVKGYCGRTFFEGLFRQVEFHVGIGPCGAVACFVTVPASGKDESE